MRYPPPSSRLADYINKLDMMASACSEYSI